MIAERPLVSVICATRNRAETLQRALQSIHQQAYKDYEVLVLDDGSDAAVFQEYDRIWADLDERFVLHRLRPSGVGGGGPSPARNQGIRLAQGTFVAFLDDDDWWVNADHLALAVKVMERCNADYYFTNMQGVRDDRVEIDNWYPNSPELTRGTLVHEAPSVYEVPLPAFLRVMKHHFVHPDNSIVRRALLTRVGGFFERVRFAEDYDLMMRIADEADRILYRPDCVARYRLPVADSISSVESRQDQTLQQLTCTQHIRAKCHRPLVRRCARAREGWILRQLAGYMISENRSGAALSFAWQAVCTYPTLGAAAFLGRSLARTVVDLPVSRPSRSNS